jgi:DNA-binding IclR family transcriptional regulator
VEGQAHDLTSRALRDTILMYNLVLFHETPWGAPGRTSRNVQPLEYHVGKKEEYAPVTRTITRAVAILQAFDAGNPELGVTEIALRTGLDKSTAYRLLYALQQGGLIAQDAGTSRYRLGPGVLRLAGLAAQQLDVAHVAHAHLVELVAETGETAKLSVLTDEDHLVRVDAVESRHQVRDVALIGHEVPLHAVSDGKVLMAGMSQARLDQVLQRELAAFTTHTVTDPARLRRQVEEIRRTGFGLAEEELELGLSGVAAPILNYEGTAVAAISVSGPSSRLPGERLREVGLVLRKTAGLVSARLGYVEPNQSTA